MPSKIKPMEGDPLVLERRSPGRPRVEGAAKVRHGTQKNEFARRLYTAMRQKNCSASNLAAAIWGYNETVVDGKQYKTARNRDRISVFLAGGGYPRLENLTKMAEYLGMTPEELAPEVTQARETRVPSEIAFTLLDGARVGFASIQINCVLPVSAALEVTRIITEAREHARNESMAKEAREQARDESKAPPKEVRRHG